MAEHASSIISEALGWEVAVAEVQNTTYLLVGYGGSEVFFDRCGKRDYLFNGQGEDEAFQRFDDAIGLGTTARCAAGTNRTTVEWEIPPISSMEEARIRVSIGQHESWRRK